MPNSPRETVRPSEPPILGAKEPSAGKTRAVRVLFWVLTIAMALFVFGAFLLPREVSVTRSAIIRAAPGTVFEHVNSFKKWEAWGPWFQRDRFLEKEFSGPDSGAGAMMSWRSREDGDGKIKIVSSMPPGSLRAAVNFSEAGDAEISFDLSGSGDGTTEVKWTFRTDFGTNMAQRYFGLLLPRVVGRDLEEGLTNLKQLLEKPAPAP